eukprot:scaffold137175_cov30-Tisochrysis_lutea.AAC.8
MRPALCGTATRHALALRVLAVERMDECLHRKRRLASARATRRLRRATSCTYRAARPRNAAHGSPYGECIA